MISKHINITSMDAETVQLGVENIKINDFENVLEYYSAIHSGCQVIITEDTADFYFSEILLKI